MLQFVKVAKRADLPADTGKCVEVAGKRIALFAIGDQIHALDDTCPHQEGPLSEGVVRGKQVICPWHAACFDITTGKALAGPVPRGVNVYPTRISGDDVEVQV